MANQLIIASIMAGLAEQVYLHGGTLPFNMKRSPNNDTVHIKVGDLYALRISDHENPNPSQSFTAEVIVSDGMNIEDAIFYLCDAINIKLD